MRETVREIGINVRESIQKRDAKGNHHGREDPFGKLFKNTKGKPVMA
jgi:hypothetical protein